MRVSANKYMSLFLILIVCLWCCPSKSNLHVCYQRIFHANKLISWFLKRFIGVWITSSMNKWVWLWGCLEERRQEYCWIPIFDYSDISVSNIHPLIFLSLQHLPHIDFHLNSWLIFAYLCHCLAACNWTWFSTTLIRIVLVMNNKLPPHVAHMLKVHRAEGRTGWWEEYEREQKRKRD